jgi:NADH-quinone oxidoreductase subunit N
MAALAFAICVFSLMGFPPTAGFLGKVYIFSSAFSLDSAHSFHGPLVVLAVIGVVNSAIGAAYYLRLVAAVYISRDEQEVVPTGGTPVRLGLALCSIGMLFFFVWPSGLVDRAQANADVVLHGQRVAAVVTTASSAGQHPSDGTGAAVFLADSDARSASDSRDE